MHVELPKLRMHNKGYWFCHWGGKNHYFSKNKTKARMEYARSLEEWATWREAREERRLVSLSNPHVIELVERFMHGRELEIGTVGVGYYRKHLKRFSHAFGRARADMIRAEHVQAIKNEMLKQGYKPKTVNHDIGAIKTFMTWCMDFDHVPPVRLNGVKKIGLEPPISKAYPVENVRAMVKRAPEHMRAWLAVNYLCCMRPSEVTRVASQQGEWVELGIYQIVNKVGRRTGMRRRVVFSDEALTWFERLTPHWSRLDSYSQAVRDFFGVGVGPGPLRHSAATHLHQAGVARVDVGLLLGHLPPRVSQIYAPIEWTRLRAIAARITLRSDS